jgi:cullin 3
MLPPQGLHGDEIDFENTWATIEAAFREIHTKNASKLSYEELYRHAYRIVLKKKGEDLYRNVHEFERRWLSSEVRSTIRQLLSSNLLVDAQSLGGTTANERRVAGEKFLKGLKQAWGDHQVCMSMLADVLMYMVSRLLTAAALVLPLMQTAIGSCLLLRQSPTVHLQCRHGPFP